MGIDWETILGAEGEDLAGAYEDHVGPVETERRSAFDYDYDNNYFAWYSEPDDYVDSEDDCADPVDFRAYSGPKVKALEARRRISKRISGTPRRKDGRKESSCPVHHI